MPTYVILGNWTELGAKGLKDSPKRAAAFRTGVEAAGGKVLHFLYAMGPHDFVVVFEAPNDDVVNEVVLRGGMAGTAHTVTSKAWTEAEFAKLVARL